jgi:hypothetical protein
MRRRIEGNTKIRPLKLPALLLYKFVVRTKKLSDDFKGNTLARIDSLGRVVVDALSTEPCAGAEMQFSPARKR